MRLFRWRKDSGEIDALDSYWDQLTTTQPGTPVPMPAGSRLITFTYHAQTTAAGDRTMPPFADSLLESLLVAQQKERNPMHAHTQVVASPPRESVPWTEVNERRFRHLDRVAILAVMLIGIVLAAMFGPRLDGDQTPVLLAPTDEATPPGEASPPASNATVLWRSSDLNSEAIRPVGLGVAPDGNIWVGDGDRASFAIFTPDGELLERWGGPGVEGGEFNWVRDINDSAGDATDIAWARDGSFYVIDPGNFRVQKFAADRTFLLAFGSQGIDPGEFTGMFSVAVAPDGNVHVLEDPRGIIQVFSPDGEYLWQTVAIANDVGTLYNPGGIAIDSDGNIWVADWGKQRIATYDSTGAFRYSFGRGGVLPGGFQEPFDVSFDRGGNLIVADHRNNRVQILTVDGYPLVLWDVQGEPIAVGASEDGVVYVLTEGSGDLVAWSVTVPTEPMPGSTPVAVMQATPAAATPAQNEGE